MKVDADTLEHYCLTFFDFSDIKHLLRKFEPFNLSLKTLTLPIIKILLKEGQVEKAATLCKYNMR